MEGKLEEVERMLEKIKALSVTTYQDILNEEAMALEQLAELEGKQKQLKAEMSSIESQLISIGKDSKQKNIERESTAKETS